jgi:hypothetical protein
MKPKEKGDMAVAHAIFYFQTHGYEVCLPIGDKKPYDLVVEKNGELEKVQVKYGGKYGWHGRCCVALRTMGGNQSYHTAKRYRDSDFDLLFAHTANGNDYLIPWSAVREKTTITVESSVYEKYMLK